jgi:pyruvate dehydrogenase E2 component (dihydrolipoamide acetyltransferase)
MAEFRMPSLGADMRFGTLLEWHVRPGDQVHRGDVVALVDTEKAAIEVEVFEDGVVEELLVPEGTRVPVGTALARLRGGPAAEVAVPLGAAAAAPSAAPPPLPSPAGLPGELPLVPPPLPRGPAAGALRPLASPAARRLAAVRRIDLAKLVGSGPHGAIQRRDVERAAGAGAGPEHPVRVSPLAARVAEKLRIDVARIAGTGPGGAVTREDVERAAIPAGAAPEAAAGADRAAAMRQAIAAAMERSKREIPHYYLSTRVELSRALAWLEAENARRSVEERLLPAALMVKAVALALRAYPELNGFWIDGAFRPGGGIHVGVAISLRTGGLIAPALLDADAKDLSTLMRELRDLVGRTRSGGLRGSELTSPTITVTNLGDRGVDVVFGVIYPPQVAIVGFGRVSERPWAENGMLAVRPVVDVTLAADHRASDGHRGGLFLDEIGHRLQTPEEL